MIVTRAVVDLRTILYASGSLIRNLFEECLGGVCGAVDAVASNVVFNQFRTSRGL